MVVLGEWPRLLKGGGPGVYSFEAFTPEFCRKLLEEIDHAQQHYRKLLVRPNGMNRYGMVLNQLGLEPAITELQQTYLAGQLRVEQFVAMLVEGLDRGRLTR